MSETIYPKKYINSYMSFKKTSFSQEDREKDIKDYYKDEQKTKDSWKILSNLKTTKNFRKANSIGNYKKPVNNLILLNRQKLNKKNKDESPGEKIVFGFIFNKAPTLRKNHIEINNIIKKKRIKKIKELNNIYNNILISESKSFRNNLYVANSKYFTQKNNGIRRNRSCDEYTLKKFNSYKTIKELNSNNENSIFSKTGFNFNVSTNCFEDNLPNNKSTIFHDLSKSKIADKTSIFPSLTSHYKYKCKSITSSLNSVTKMRIQVNDAIFNDHKKIKEFAEIEKRIILFNVIQNIQSNKIKNFKGLKEITLDNKYHMLIKLKNTIENRYLKYVLKMNNYLYFLNAKIEEEQDELYFLEKELFNNEKGLEKLILKTIKKQEELEYLLNIRNFLLQLKDKYKQNERPPSYYFELLIKDSKKILLGNFLLKSKIINQMTDKNLSLFIDSVLDLKQKIKENKKNNKGFDCDTNSVQKGKVGSIFESPEEFMKFYNILMDRNLIHLQEFECIKKILTKLKVEYDEVCIGDNNNDPLEKEIIEKEEIKKKLMEKNKILKKNFFYYNEIIIKRNTQIELNSQKIKKKKLKYLDIEIDLDSIHREKYKQKIKTLKYKGLLLFDKIIQVIKNIINENYVKNDFYENFQKEKLKIIELDISFFDDENIQLIDTYIKKLVSIYEDVCKYVLYNHIQYKSKKKNLVFINKKLEEFNNEKKIKLSKEQRIIQFARKIEENKKILEKFYKPIYYIENKTNTDTKIKRREMIKIKCDKKLEDEEKNFAENEFNSLTKYNEEEEVL